MGDGDFATGYAIGQNDGNSRNSGGMFGDGNWLWIIVVFALLFGWGGYGGFGGNAGGQSGTDTRTAVYDGFAMNGLDNGIRSLQNGLCDGFYAMNTSLLQGFNGTNMGMLQGFNGVQSQLSSNAAQQQARCCETQKLIERGFADTNYNMATQACETRQAIQNSTRDIIDSQNAGTRAVLDFLTQSELNNLRSENQTLKFAASQSNQNAYLAATMEAQTAELIRRINPTPVPSYSVPAPYPFCGQLSGCGC